MSSMQITVVDIKKSEDTNIIFGQSHFIKTVEDLYEAVIQSVPGASFGIAFNEASGPCLIRTDGTDEGLISVAATALQIIGAGHTFMIVMRGMFPINCLNAVKNVPEVCAIYAATANPLQVVVAETEQGRGVLGVIDGNSPKGIETDVDKQTRRDFLRKIGYKR